MGTLESFRRWFKPSQLHSNPEMRSDLFSQTPSETLITEFLASTGRMRFQSHLLQLESNPQVSSGATANISLLLRMDDATGASRLGDASNALPAQDVWSWLADAAIPDLRASHGQNRIATTFKERQEAQLWSGRLGAGPGTALSLIAFAGLAKLMSIVL